MFKSQANIVLQDGRADEKPTTMQNNPNMDQGNEGVQEVVHLLLDLATFVYFILYSFVPIVEGEWVNENCIVYNRDI